MPLSGCVPVQRCVRQPYSSCRRCCRRRQPDSGKLQAAVGGAAWQPEELPHSGFAWHVWASKKRWEGTHPCTTGLAAAAACLPHCHSTAQPVLDDQECRPCTCCGHGQRASSGRQPCRPGRPGGSSRGRAGSHEAAERCATPRLGGQVADSRGSSGSSPSGRTSTAAGH